MRKFAWLATALILCISTFIVFMRFAGGTQSHDFARIFTTPDGSPCDCIFGIRAGETSTDDAMALLKQHPLTAKLINAQSSRVITFAGNGFALNLNRSSTDYIQSIELSFYADYRSTLPVVPFNIPTAGDMLIHFGLPPGIQMDAVPLRSSNRFRAYNTWYYPPQKIAAITLMRKLYMDAHDSVAALEMYSSERPGLMNPPTLTSIRLVRYTNPHWIGFTTMRRFSMAR